MNRPGFAGGCLTFGACMASVSRAERWFALVSAGKMFPSGLNQWRSPLCWMLFAWRNPSFWDCGAQPIFGSNRKTARQRGSCWPLLPGTKRTAGGNQLIALLMMRHPAQVQKPQANRTRFRGGSRCIAFA